MGVPGKILRFGPKKPLFWASRGHVPPPAPPPDAHGPDHVTYPQAVVRRWHQIKQTKNVCFYSYAASSHFMVISAFNAQGVIYDPTRNKNSLRGHLAGKMYNASLCTTFRPFFVRFTQIFHYIKFWKRFLANIVSWFCESSVDYRSRHLLIHISRRAKLPSMILIFI